MVDWGMSIQEAVNVPNAVYPRGSAFLESKGYDAQIITALEAMGHKITERDLTSGIHGFVKTGDSFEGAADPRREGSWMVGDVE